MDATSKQCPPPMKKMGILFKESRQVHVGKYISGWPIPRHVPCKPFASEHSKLKAIPQQGKVMGGNTLGCD